MIRNICAAAAALILAAGAAHAQDVRGMQPADAAPVPAKLADLKGMIGAWQADGGSAGFSMTADGQIVGHLELGDGSGKPRVEELWIIRQDGPTVTVSQKHFTPTLEAREAVDVWAHRKLVAVNPGGVYLENLTWLTQGDTLTLMVRLQTGVSTVVMKRVK